MGNIHYAEGNYLEAIKMYQMVLDHITQEDIYTGFKVFHNVVNAFIKIGKYRDAVQNYESSMSSSLDHEIGANALLCYVVLGDAGEIKQCFTKITLLTLNQVGE